MILVEKEKKSADWRRKNKKTWVFLLAPIFFVLLFALLVAYFEIRHQNNFYPGISIAGEYVGGKSYSEVLTSFQKRADIITKNGITINIEGKKGLKEVQIPALYNGLTTDNVFECFSLNGWEKEIKNAYATGHTGTLWQKITEQFNSLVVNKNFAFSPIIQKETITTFLNSASEDFFEKTAPAQFSIKNGQIYILPEVIGEKLNTDEIVATLSKKLETFNTSPINAKVEKEIPFTTEAKLQSFLNIATQISNSTNLIFRYNEYSWNISGNTLATWLTVKENNHIGINQKKLEEYFNKTVLYYIDSPMENSRFEMQNNQLVEISQGKTGNVADIKKTSQKIEENISNIDSNQNLQPKTIDILIETTQEAPKITKETISKYEIKELVGSASTNFAGGSLNRQHNIEVGSSKLNGILLAPGEEFSAVDAIGDITTEAGFVEEYVISGGRTKKELGGGLCQIATTLFRLALDTGLPITERINHHYVIPYYGAGLDATMYGPHPDLRFVNDTGNYLLMQARAVNNEVVLEFYGKKDGRVVEISEPVLYDKTYPAPTKLIPTTDLPSGKTQCTEIAHTGITADATYTVTYPSGEIKETNFHSVYSPWQKVCLIGI